MCPDPGPTIGRLRGPLNQPIALVAPLDAAQAGAARRRFRAFAAASVIANAAEDLHILAGTAAFAPDFVRQAGVRLDVALSLDVLLVLILFVVIVFELIIVVRLIDHVGVVGKRVNVIVKVIVGHRCLLVALGSKRHTKTPREDGRGDTAISLRAARGARYAWRSCARSS